MAYLHIPLNGSSHSARQPDYGVALARTAKGAVGAANLLTAPRFVDFRFQRGQLQTVRLNQLTFAQRDPATGRLNAFGDASDVSSWVVGGIAVLGVLCLTETWICEDDNNAAAPPPDPA